MRETHIKLTSDVTIGLITDLLEKHYGELGYSIENIEEVKGKFVEAILNKPRKGTGTSLSSRGGSGRRESRPDRGGIFGAPRGGSGARGGRFSGSRGPIGEVGKGRAPYDRDDRVDGGLQRPSGTDNSPVRDFIGDNVFLTVELEDVAKKRALEDVDLATAESFKSEVPATDVASEILVEIEDINKDDAIAVFKDVANDLAMTTEDVAHEFGESAGLSDGGKI